MNKKVLIAAIVVLVLGAGSMAFGRFGARRGMGFGHEMGIAKLQARLKLTPEQTKQMREIMASRRAKLGEQWGAGRQTRETLMKEIFTDNPNQAEIQKRVEALEQQHAQMLNELVAGGLELNKILTPEQRLEMQKMINERVEVRQHMREYRRQHRRPQRGEMPPAPAVPPGEEQ